MKTESSPASIPALDSTEFESLVEQYRSWKTTPAKPSPGTSAESIAAVLAGTMPCALLMPCERIQAKPWLDYARWNGLYVRNFRPKGRGYYTVVGDKATCDKVVDTWTHQFDGSPTWGDDSSTWGEEAIFQRRLAQLLGYPETASNGFIAKFYSRLE